MKRIFLITLFLFSFAVSATPQKIVGWFLTEPKIAALDHFVFFASLAQNDFPEGCLPMGDGCFHPQMGYIGPKNLEKEKSLVQEVKEDLKIKTFNSLDTDLVDCDKKYGFDIFCGKAQKEIPKGNEIEIWIDTSSSMKKADFSSEPNFCYRREMLSSVFDRCKKKASIFVYDTSKKELGDLSGACINSGMNDDKRFIEWVKNSETKSLFFVTDIEEYTERTREFLALEKAEIRGMDANPLSGKDLMKLAEEIVKACK